MGVRNIQYVTQLETLMRFLGETWPNPCLVPHVSVSEAPGSDLKLTEAGLQPG